MIRWRGRQALCFRKVLKSGLFWAESKLVLAEPPLNGVWAKKSALKVSAVRLGGLKGPREGHGGVVRKVCVISVVCVIRVSRKIRALSALCALRSLLRDCGIWVPRPGRLTRRWRIGWRPGAELRTISCLLVRVRTKAPGRLAMPWMIGWRNWRVVWINSVLLVDTLYR
jgi:hypothetical protein